MVIGKKSFRLCGQRSIAFLVLLIASSAVAETRVGSWELREEHSELDGNRSVSAVVHSEKQIVNSIGLPENAALAVVCSDNEARVVVDFRNFMGSDQVFIRYRFDSGPVEDDRVSVSADGQYFGWRGGSAKALIGAMSGKKRVVIAAPPYGKKEAEASFDIGGIDDVIFRIAAACRWS